MRSITALAAIAIALAGPSAALANPAVALSISRAGAAMENESALSKGEIYPLLGIAAIAILVIVLADEKVDGEEPVSA